MRISMARKIGRDINDETGKCWAILPEDRRKHQTVYNDDNTSTRIRAAGARALKIFLYFQLPSVP